MIRLFGVSKENAGITVSSCSSLLMIVYADYIRIGMLQIEFA